MVVLVLALVLTWLVFDQLDRPNPLRDAVSRVTAPIQLVLRRGARPVGALFSRLGSLRNLEAENAALRSENAQLTQENILLLEAKTANETLRRQLAFKSTVPTYHLLSAEVIGYDPSNLPQYLVIDRGADDGIKVGMAVLADEGLVGRISRVNAASSKIMLITDPSSSVNALIQRSRATGLVQGTPGEQVLTMRYIPQEDAVLPGDIVLTSGLGGNLPKRLIIGQVLEVKREDVAMFQEAIIHPTVNLRDLEVVMVLLNFTPINLVDEPTTDVAP